MLHEVMPEGASARQEHSGPLSHQQPSVLIVGAGPTGLTLATVLARSGISVRIVEKKAGLSRFTKATNLMQRNQELIAALGLLDPLNAVSGQMRRLMVHAYGKCFGPRTMRLKESPCTDVVLCGQHNFERVMADGLTASGIAIDFATELTGLRQDPQKVTATLVTAGETAIIAFDYVVGCDGHDGITRTFTRHDFQPQKTGVAIRQVDARLRWRRLSSMEQLWLFYFDHGFAVVVPLPGGIHRVLTIEPKAAMPEREPTLVEMQAKLRSVADDDSVTLTDAEWFSYTDLSMGIAPGLRDGRVFLAGDVGNPVLPNGGQGMNTGIADAYDLGWKLAAVLRHGAPQRLLDTYNEERHALRTSLQRAQFNSLKYTTLHTPKIMQAAFRRLVEPVLDRGGEYRMAQVFSELTLHLRQSSMTLEGVRSKGVRAGDRAFDAAVVHSSVPLQLYQLLYRGGWTLLAFTGRRPDVNFEAASQALRHLQRADLSAYIVSTDSRTLERGVVLYDLDEEAHRVYGVRAPTLMLVRPDGYVAVRLKTRDVDRLAVYLAGWVPDASQRFRGGARAEGCNKVAR